MSKPTERGQRKIKHTREQTLVLLLGFCVATWMKAPTELFVAFGVCLTGLSGAFILGNVKVHQANAEAAPATTPGEGKP